MNKCYSPLSKFSRYEVMIFTRLPNIVWKSDICTDMTMDHVGKEKKKKFFTPPTNHGGVRFSLQFACVCVSLSVNIITTDGLHQFCCHLYSMVAYFIVLNPVVISNLGPKVKVSLKSNDNEFFYKFVKGCRTFSLESSQLMPVS